MEKYVDKSIEIIVLDRPNPLNGVDLEGNILELEFESFIGRHRMPVRHSLTIGEVARMHQSFWAKSEIDLKVINMQNWHSEMYFEDTQLPWLLPSPNLARTDSAFTFPGTVLFEGTCLSEGRGTSQPLEIVGHPKIEPFSFYADHLYQTTNKTELKGFVLRPIMFLPTFHKQVDKVCGGFQIHVTNRRTFQPWRLGQFIMRELYHHLGNVFQWLDPPCEYNYHQMPIDIINGTDKLRHWVEGNGSMETLDDFEMFDEYNEQVNSIKLY